MLKRIMKAIGWSIVILLILLILGVYSLRLPAVQDYITTKAVNFYQEKVNHKAAIGRLYVDFPSNVTIEDLYLENEAGDTLLYNNYLSVRTDLWDLLDNALTLSDIEIDGINSTITRDEKGEFNFQFIIDAFATSSSDTTQSSNFSFGIGGVHIQHANLRYLDEYEGVFVTGNIGAIQTIFSKFDLNNSQIFIDETKLADSRVSLELKQAINTKVDTVSGSSDSNFKIGGNLIELDKVKFDMEDQVSRLKMNNEVGYLKATIEELDITTNRYNIDQIELKDAFVSIDQFSTPADSSTQINQVAEPSTSPEINLNAGFKNAAIVNSAIRYYDHSAPKLENGFDPSRIWVQKLNGRLKESYFINGEVYGEVKDLALQQVNGKELHHLTGKWKYNETGASIKNLDVQLGDTKIKGDLSLDYPSIKALENNPGNLQFGIAIDNANIKKSDILYFAPDLKDQLSTLPATISMELKTQGRLSSFEVEHLAVYTLKNTRLNTGGTVKGLPDFQTAYFDLHNTTIRTSRADIKNLVADTLLQQQLTLPESMDVAVEFKGTMRQFNTDFQLNTNWGNARFKGEVDQSPDSVYTYQGDLAINKLQLDELLSNNELGPLTLSTAIQGRGFSLERLNTTVKGQVAQLTYHQYSYKGLTIDGNFKNKQFEGHLALIDENLDFDFNGLINLYDSIPTYQFNLELHQADLQALNFTNKSLKIRGNVETQLKAKSLKSINGQLQMTDFTIAKEGFIYQLDSVALNSTTNASKTDLSLYSPIVDAQVKGNFDWTTLPKVLKEHFDSYFSQELAQNKTLEPQTFTFTIDFKDLEFFQNILVPGLDEFVPGTIEGKYSSAEWLLDIDINVNKLDYKGNSLDSLGVHIQSDKESFDFKAEVASMYAFNYDFNNLELTGSLVENHVKADFRITDNQETDKYHLGGRLNFDSSAYSFRFDQGEFVLNHQPWKVNANNEIRYNNGGIWVDDLAISKGKQSVNIQSKTTEKEDSLLSAKFTNFDLSFVGKQPDSEDFILGGVLNGDLTAFINDKSLKADAAITQFSYEGDTLGDIELMAANKANVTDLNLSVKSSGNDVKVAGNIKQEKQTHLDLKANINKLNLATVESFTANQLSQMHGKVDGSFTIRGTVDKPKVDGQLNFNEVAFSVNYIGSRYRLNNETISFNNSDVVFDNFKILDEQDDPLTIDGNINSSDYRDFTFALEMRANGFQVLHTDEKNNPLVFGDLSINTNAQITGNLNNPKVRMDVSAVGSSHVTYVIPESEISVQQRKGVVEFFDEDLENDPFFESKKEPADTTTTWIKGLDLIANIDVDNTNTFNIVIDPITRDQLTVSGDANLALKMRPTGDMTLTGRYEVSDGSYELNFYGIAKRKFDINKGSHLIWTGDPLNAQMNVNATYFVRATPLDMEVRKKIPFDVLLNIKGQLLSPEISFQLNLAEEAGVPISVQSWVSSINQQESQLNQQVFSLLLFKSFMSSGGLGSGSDTNVAQTTARNSVSRILSNQLNRLGSKIQGVELSFDLQSYEDYNDSGNAIGRTELELGLSKQFFNDRVVVKVAGNFDLEGQNRKQQNLSDFAGDIKVEYKLTEDGRFRLQGFRQNEYDNLLQGEIAKTGVGVIFVRDYNVLKELFKPRIKEEDNE